MDAVQPAAGFAEQLELGLSFGAPTEIENLLDVELREAGVGRVVGGAFAKQQFCRSNLSFVHGLVDELHLAVRELFVQECDIGPEGGFIDYEIVKLQQAGFVTMDLGPRIYRVETAVSYTIGKLFG